MKIKTFPLQFTEDELDVIANAAKKQGKSIKQFILDIIAKEVTRDE